MKFTVVPIRNHWIQNFKCTLTLELLVQPMNENNETIKIKWNEK